MLKIHPIAAIDIGSNAIRLLISHVIEDSDTVHFRKASLIRVPVRLGHDVFIHGSIREEKINKLITSCKAFYNLMQAYDVEQFRACATSAMREAANSREILDRIKREAGIDVEVITGEEEAQIIYSTHIERLLEKDKPSMYVDIGGGSTEITFFKGLDVKASRSFNLGTVRMLDEKVDPGLMDDLKSWLQKNSAGIKGLQTIGSGGTINKISKMIPTRKKDGQIFSYHQFREVYNLLKDLSVDERITRTGLGPDRADVVIPAAQIMLSVMKWSGSKSVMVPKFGLADGMVRLLFEQRVNA
ncbi:MAG: exopolyphosphatase [Flavobacteriales bacterium]|nr:exopolyphosphatase [Flavobacteriales bacterium]MCB9446852.1 exopolyphosphatase [Flavobacteriales bacterium]